MKEKFRFYYEEPNFNDLWKECRFIFDTNILLNLYRYPKVTGEDLIKKLENEIPTRLWMPHQVTTEYQEERYRRIKEQTEFYSNLKGKIKNAKDAFDNAINKAEIFKQDHYYLNPNIHQNLKGAIRIN